MSKLAPADAQGRFQEWRRERRRAPGGSLDRVIVTAFRRELGLSPPSGDLVTIDVPGVPSSGRAFGKRAEMERNGSC